MLRIFFEIAVTDEDHFFFFKIIVILNRFSRSVGKFYQKQTQFKLTLNRLNNISYNSKPCDTPCEIGLTADSTNFRLKYMNTQTDRFR